MTAIANLVHETSTGTGTGNLTLAPLNGKKTFDVAFGHGATTNVFWYFISNAQAAEWEVGTGHMSDATTLVRDTVVESSNANAAVNFSAGTKYVGNDFPAAGFATYNASTGGLIFYSSTYYPSFRGNAGNITIAVEPLINSLNNVIFFGSGTGPGGVGTAITSRRQNGTDASPTATLNGDELFFLQAYAYDGASFSQSIPPAVVMSATEDWNTGAHGSAVMFQGVPNGSITGQVEASFGNGLVLQNTGVSAIQGNGRGTLTVQATTASTSTTTGAVVVAGGIGAGGDINSVNVNVTTAYKVAGTQVVGSRDTGWTAMTGSPDKASAYATSTVTLAQLAGRVAELQAILTAHGLIGA